MIADDFGWFLERHSIEVIPTDILYRLPKPTYNAREVAEKIEQIKANKSVTRKRQLNLIKRTILNSRECNHCDVAYTSKSRTVCDRSFGTDDFYQLRDLSSRQFCKDSKQVEISNQEQRKAQPVEGFRRIQQYEGYSSDEHEDPYETIREPPDKNNVQTFDQLKELREKIKTSRLKDENATELNSKPESDDVRANADIEVTEIEVLPEIADLTSILRVSGAELADISEIIHDCSKKIEVETPKKTTSVQTNPTNLDPGDEIDQSMHRLFGDVVVPETEPLEMNGDERLSLILDSSITQDTCEKSQTHNNIVVNETEVESQRTLPTLNDSEQSSEDETSATETNSNFRMIFKNPAGIKNKFRHLKSGQDTTTIDSFSKGITINSTINPRATMVSPSLPSSRSSPQRPHSPNMLDPLDKSDGEYDDNWDENRETSKIVRSLSNASNDSINWSGGETVQTNNPIFDEVEHKIDISDVHFGLSPLRNQPHKTPQKYFKRQRSFVVVEESNGADEFNVNVSDSESEVEDFSKVEDFLRKCNGISTRFYDVAVNGLDQIAIGKKSNKEIEPENLKAKSVGSGINENDGERTVEDEETELEYHVSFEDESDVTKEENESHRSENHSKNGKSVENVSSVSFGESIQPAEKKIKDNQNNMKVDSNEDNVSKETDEDTELEYHVSFEGESDVTKEENESHRSENLSKNRKSVENASSVSLGESIKPAGKKIKDNQNNMKVDSNEDNVSKETDEDTELEYHVSFEGESDVTKEENESHRSENHSKNGKSVENASSVSLGESIKPAEKKIKDNQNNMKVDSNEDNVSKETDEDTELEYQVIFEGETDTNTEEIEERPLSTHSIAIKQNQENILLENNANSLKSVGNVETTEKREEKLDDTKNNIEDRNSENRSTHDGNECEEDDQAINGMDEEEDSDLDYFITFEGDESGDEDEDQKTNERPQSKLEINDQKNNEEMETTDTSISDNERINSTNDLNANLKTLQKFETAAQTSPSDSFEMEQIEKSLMESIRGCSSLYRDLENTQIKQQIPVWLNDSDSDSSSSEKSQTSIVQFDETNISEHDSGCESEKSDIANVDDILEGSIFGNDDDGVKTDSHVDNGGFVRVEESFDPCLWSQGGKSTTRTTSKADLLTIEKKINAWSQPKMSPNTSTLNFSTKPTQSTSEITPHDVKRAMGEENYKKVTTNFPLIENFNPKNQEFFLIQCPVAISNDDLIGQTINFRVKSKMKINGTKYTSTVSDPVRDATIIARFDENHDELTARTLKISKVVTLVENFKVKDKCYTVPETNDRVEYPSGILRKRHPIFGHDFSKKIEVSEDVASKIKKARKTIDKHARKLEKKRKTVVAQKNDSMLEYSKLIDTIGNVFDQVKPEMETPKSSKKSSRKRRLSEDLFSGDMKEVKVENKVKSEMIADEEEIEVPTKRRKKDKKNKHHQPDDEIVNHRLKSIDDDEEPKTPKKKKKKSKVKEEIKSEPCS